MKKNKIKSTISDLLTSMGFSDCVVEVRSDKDQTNVNIQSLPEQSGILIGRHGEGIDALQLITNLIVNNQTQDWQRVTVNINDYRETREETIKRMATKAAENAKRTGKEVVLNYLPSHERRIAHLHLDQDKDIQTYSQGEGRYRRMVIAPANQES